jgi:hypothetical protein
MNGPSSELFGTVLLDSRRKSLIVVASPHVFLTPPVPEVRSAGPFSEVPIMPIDELGITMDRFVTCVMVVWAVSIFVGMSYLAAII